ncbi:protein translocase subunit SecA [Candidatus Dependentiae bacterium Noda2021]|nr:protein translocase subunit SecA [Candidatus Dependentiae bacterium Noda2021]
MIARILALVLGTNNARQLRQIKPIVEKINSLEGSISSLNDAELAAKTNEFREQLSQGKTLNDILPEAFAVVREVSKRKLGQRHFDVQLIGGIVLHQGKISEMKTGEGKTLTSTLPLYLNALEGKGVHLVTVNDYLALRDSEWMAPIFNFLGLTVGCLQHDMNDEQRKKQYACDILYGTNSQFGFDYLRDNMKFRLEDYVQRDLNFAIVDEVDSILIDEARTPLIISGATDEESKLYVIADQVVRHLKRDTDFEIDEKARTVQLTESGNDRIEQVLRINNLYAIEHLNLLHHIYQALRAHVIFKRDVDYAVMDNEVLIVDEFTGRMLPGRRYSDGLHQAIEAKERVEIEKESQTLAAITLQNYFRLYKKLAGMTGTAMTEAEEFYKIYKLDVVSVPTNRSMIRLDKPDLIFLSNRTKYEAIVKDIKERYEKKQPVLIGTIAIEKSELLSEVLTANGVPHEVLNAKNHAREAEIVAHAGEPGRVTIATNMAGRGTDIKLTKESIEAGGLYILGTERHESRRIDNQLRGRSGRQGDPGESRFYISLEDDLIRRFAGDRLKKYMQRAGMKEDEVIEDRSVSKVIEWSQERVEKQNFEARKYLLEYDDVLNQQRIVIYRYRRSILEGQEQIFDLIRDLILETTGGIISKHAPQRTVSKEQFDQIIQEVHQITGLEVSALANAGITYHNQATLASDLGNYILEQYSLYRNQRPQDIIQSAEKWLLLEALDQAWKQHMYNLDHLKEGIGLRSFSQKNPLIEYKREAFEMFRDMMDEVRKSVMHHLFHLNIERFDQAELEEKREREFDRMNFSAPSENPGEGATAAQQEARNEPRTGRNDPCPCGSGKKYKKCHGE